MADDAAEVDLVDEGCKDREHGRWIALFAREQLEGI